MAETNFVKTLADVLRAEGGYTNNPKDPGGATNRGITQRVYDAFRAARGVSRAQVKFIAMADVVAIYRDQYWNAVKANSLPVGIDYLVFDEAVLSGVIQAAKDLQRCVGAKADGHIGFMTLAAVGKAKNLDAIADAICDRRLSWMHRLKTWSIFDKGWTARINTARANAHTMIRSARAPAAPTPAPQTATPATVGQPLTVPRSLVAA